MSNGKCEKCEAKAVRGDYCQACLIEKHREFRENWSWKSPSPFRCISKSKDGERCPFLAEEKSKYCPTCRRMYDLAIRCEFVKIDGQRCMQFKEKGFDFCWTHRRHLEKLTEREREERLNKLLRKLTEGSVEALSPNVVKELMLAGKLEPVKALTLMMGKTLGDLAENIGRLFLEAFEKAMGQMKELGKTQEKEKGNGEEE